jgi:hypothetical protein
LFPCEGEVEGVLPAPAAIPDPPEPPPEPPAPLLFPPPAAVIVENVLGLDPPNVGAPAPTVTVISLLLGTENPDAVLYPPAPPPPLHMFSAKPPPPITRYSTVGVEGRFGVIELDALDAEDVPAADAAVTVNVYAVPVVSPVTVIGLDDPVPVAPPGEAVTV